MIAYIFQTTVCLFGFYLLYMIFLQKETFFQVNRWYIIGTLAVSLVIPFLPHLFSQNEPLLVASLQPVAMTINDLTSSLSQASPSSFHWTDLLLAVYTFGVLIQLFRLSKGLFDIHHLHQNGERISSNDLSLVMTKKPHLPFSFFRTLYIYEDHGLSEVELNKILTHEATHAQEWHSLDILFIELVGCFLWLNPMIYMYRKLIRDVHEYLADATVLESTSLKMYGQILLSQKHSGIQLALANNFFNSQLKNRINMMTRKRSNAWSGLKYLAILPLLLITISLFSFQQRSTENDTSTNNQSSIVDPSIIEQVTVVGFGKTQSANIDREPLVNQESANKTLESLLQEVDEMPIFPGCTEFNDIKEKRTCSDQKLLQFVYSTLKYPAAARKAGISGKAVASFIVTKEGAVKEVTIIRSLSPEIDTEVERVLVSMNMMTEKWIPAVKDGKNVEVKMTIPVLFKLEDDQKPAKTKQPEYVILVKGQEYDPAIQVENIDPNDIESIDVRKDATEAEIQKYGEQAKNGIVMINMKDGKVIDKSKESGYKLSFETSEPMKKNGEEIFKVVEEMPRFPGCEGLELSKEERSKCAQKKMLEYVYSNIKYPKEAKERGVQGRNVVQFIVRKNGDITDIKSVRDIGAGTANEVLRVIESMNSMSEKWIPGMQRGQKVDVQFTLPISFKLDDRGSLPVKDNKPVFVVDGELFKTGLVEIDPEQIETINVVKEPSQEEITKYGEQANLGIIYITLKKKSSKTKTLKESKERSKSILIEKNNNQNTAEIFKVVEEMPRFPGCEDSGLAKAELNKCAQEKMLEFIYMNIVYPAEARKKGIEGRSVIQFVIETNGSVSNMRIVRSIGGGTDEAVMKVVDDMNYMGEKWIPGKQRGIAVRVQYTLPISFKLEGAKKVEPIEERTNELKLSDYSVSPNPSNGTFNIQFIADPVPLKLTVMDMFGKVVYTDEDSNFKGMYNKQFDFGHIASGQYLLVITQKDKTHARHIQIQK